MAGYEHKNYRNITAAVLKQNAFREVGTGLWVKELRALAGEGLGVAVQVHRLNDRDWMVMLLQCEAGDPNKFEESVAIPGRVFRTETDLMGLLWGLTGETH